MWVWNNSFVSRKRVNRKGKNDYIVKNKWLNSVKRQYHNITVIFIFIKQTLNVSHAVYYFFHYNV